MFDFPTKLEIHSLKDGGVFDSLPDSAYKPSQSPVGLDRSKHVNLGGLYLVSIDFRYETLTCSGNGN